MMFGIVIQPIGAPSEGWWNLIGTYPKANGLRRRYLSWKAAV